MSAIMGRAVAKRKPLPEALSPTKVAQILGVHVNTIRRWILRRYIIAIRVGPHTVRIPRSEVLRMRKHRMYEPWDGFNGDPYHRV